MRSKLPRQPLKYAIIAVLLAGLITCIPATATAVAAEEQTSDEVPGVPAVYYGNLIINGDPAPANTTIEAVVRGEVRGSITTETAGEYGGPNASDDKLTVSGQFDQQGTEVVFYITADGLKRGQANQTATWSAGEINELNLTGNLASEDTNEGGTGGGIAPPSAPTPPSLPTDQREDSESTDQSEQNNQPESDSSSGENPEQPETSTTDQESEDETPGFGFIISTIGILSAVSIFLRFE